MIILLRSLSSNHALGGEFVLLQNSIYEFALRRTNNALGAELIDLVPSEAVLLVMTSKVDVLTSKVVVLRRTVPSRTVLS